MSSSYLFAEKQLFKTESKIHGVRVATNTADESYKGEFKANRIVEYLTYL